MLEVTRTATFTAGQPADESLTTIVARSVLEAALAEDEPGRLWFEVGGDDDSRMLEIDLSTADLEELLRMSGATTSRCTLDGDEVAGLFDDPDVEGARPQGRDRDRRDERSVARTGGAGGGHTVRRNSVDHPARRHRSDDTSRRGRDDADLPRRRHDSGGQRPGEGRKEQRCQAPELQAPAQRARALVLDDAFAPSEPFQRLDVRARAVFEPAEHVVGERRPRFEALTCEWLATDRDAGRAVEVLELERPRASGRLPGGRIPS